MFMLDNKFCLYEQDGKFGVVDARTKKVILNHRYNVDRVEKEVIYLKNGNILSLKEVIASVDKITEKQRFFIMEDINFKKLGVYDNKINKMVVFFSYDRIEYAVDGDGFVFYRDDKEKKMSFEKLKYVKYHSKGDFIIFAKNVSVYNSDPIQISSKDGKKVQIHR